MLVFPPDWAQGIIPGYASDILTFERECLKTGAASGFPVATHIWIPNGNPLNVLYQFPDSLLSSFVLKSEEFASAVGGNPGA